MVEVDLRCVHNQEIPLPEDFEDRLALGISIVQAAFAGKMRLLQAEIVRLTQSTEEQRGQLESLRNRNLTLDAKLLDSQQTTQQLYQENQELVKTVGILGGQVKRLEALRSAVVSSIQADTALAVDSLSPSQASASGPRLARQSSPARPSRLSASDRPSQAPATPVSPVRLSARSLSPACPGPDLSAGVSVDGRLFFKQARNRLSQEGFNLFLGSIKRLNNSEQTREQTLQDARHILGDQHKDLYGDFEHLINRQGA